MILYRRGNVRGWAMAGGAVIALAVGVYAIARLTPVLFERFESDAHVKSRALAPDFVLQDTAGQTIQLSDFKGRIVVLTFWTSWNDVAMQELSVLNEYARSLSRSNVAAFAVNSQEGKDVVQAIAAKETYRLRILLDSEGEAGEKYGIGVLPLTVFIDHAGREARRIAGPIEKEDIERYVNELRS